jgi:ribonucleoside-diphosphate reductase alpha chain
LPARHEAAGKIGLAPGLADALVDLAPHDDGAAVRFAGLGAQTATATAASAALATVRGPYPNFPRSRDAIAGRPPVRNATRIAVAPTGTLSLIAGCSSGIEPLYAVAYERHVLDGATLVEVNPRFEQLARDSGVWTPALLAKVLESGRVRHLDDVPAALRRLFPTAHEISPEQHIRLQAACQAHVDNAVSKTINLAANATVEDVAGAYRRAFESGCKGVTVYRHGAKAGQVLTPIAAPGSCPDCLSALEYSEGATFCRACGFSSAG